MKDPALRSDASPTRYVGVSFGINTLLANDKLRVFEIGEDGLRHDAAAQPPTFTANVNYWPKFVVTHEGGPLALRAKVWPYDSDPMGQNPPSAWTIESPPDWEAQTPAASGRFGILGGPGQGGRKLYFDNFKATFIEVP